MKKILSFILVFMLVLGVTACGSSKKSSDKVKVYVFFAGGCPYCESEIEYLKSLEDYDKKFEVIEKELYIDHIEWESGKDYDLGVKVATAFYEKGFEGASYQGTPFVVISNIYAEASYNPNIEDIIKKAYDEGDEDVVGKIEKGESYDIPEYLTETDKKIKDLRKTVEVNCIIIYVLLGIIIIYLIYSKVKTNEKPVVVKPAKEERKELEVKTVKEVKQTTKKPATKKKK